MAEVASAYVSLLPSFRGGAAAISRELGGSLDSAGQEGGKRFGSGMSAGIGGMAKSIVAPLAAAFAGVQVVSFFKDAISGASDLSETVNKANIIFGENAGVIQDWAAGAARNLGLSKAAALESAAGFGNMFQQLGIGGAQATEMSKSVVGLAADLGSFNNLPTEDVAQRMAAAFRGEFDSLQALIPNINAARVEQEALAMTGKESAKQLTAQEKAMATLAIVQKDGAAAAGDFAETSGGLANASKILGAQFDELKAGIGARLLPVITTVVGYLNTNMVPAFNNITAAVKAVFDLLVGGDFTGAFREIFKVEEDAGIVNFLFNMRDTAIAVFTEVKGGITAFVAAFKAGGSDVTSSGLAGAFERTGLAARALADFITGSVIPGIASLVGWLQQNQAWLLPIAVGIAAMVAAFQLYVGVMTVVRAVTAAYAVVQGVLNAVLMANPIGLIVLAIVGLVAALVYAWHNSETFREIVTAAWEGIKAAALAVANWFTTTIPALWNNIKSWTVSAWNGIVEFFKAIPGKIVAFFLNWTLPGLLIKHWDSIKAGAVAGFTAVIDFVRSVPQRIVDGLGALGGLLVSVGRDLMQGLINGITDRVGAAVRAVKDAVGNVIDGAKDLLGIASPSKVFMEIGRYTGEGLRLGIESEAASVEKAMNKLVAIPNVAKSNLNGVDVGGSSAAASRREYTLNAHNYERPLSRTDVVQAFRSLEVLDGDW